MPWKETSPEDEQVRFIERCHAPKGAGEPGEVTFVEARRHFGISRKKGYKRLQRFRSSGWEPSWRPRNHF